MDVEFAINLLLFNKIQNKLLTFGNLRTEIKTM